MDENSLELKKAFDMVSRSLFRKALLSAVTLPLVILALFSLTIFEFSSRQYAAFAIAMAAVVLPVMTATTLTYGVQQRRLRTRLLSWYEKERDPASAEDRALALRLQKSLSAASYGHGLIVAAGIFLGLVGGVIIFGDYADFTFTAAVYYTVLGLLLAITDFFVTVFISQREMRLVMEIFLSDCHGFGHHTSMSIGKRLAGFSLCIIILTLGITWIASAYQSTDLMMEELERRGADNISLLAARLDPILAEDASDAELTAVVEELSLSGSERLVIYGASGFPVYEVNDGEIDDPTWQELTGDEIPSGDLPASYYRQAGSREYLVTAASIPGNKGWLVVRADVPEAASTVSGRLSLTMLLLLLVGLGTAAFLTLLLSRNISIPIGRLIRICRRVSTGDLAVEVPVDTLDEIGELSSSYADMLTSLLAISRDLRETSAEVNEGAVNIAAVSEDLMGAIEELNALVQDLTSQVVHEVDQIHGVEDIMTGVADIISSANAKASRSSEMSLDAERLVSEGRGHAREAVEKIGEFKELLDESMDAILSLGESSQKIGTIVDIITRIAEQTNLLALNAAIEAARVPEFGKGFAVVADEVKKLAQEAAGSAQRIYDLVRVIQEDAAKAVDLMERGTMGMYVGMETVDRTDQSFASISEIVGQMARLAASIAEASSREMEDSQRLAQSLNSMKEQVEGNAGAYEEIGASTEQQTQATAELTSTAEQLAEIAQKLSDMVAHFKIS